VSVEDIARLAEEMRSNKNKERGNGDLTVLPPPSEPMAVARLFVELHCQHKHMLTVRCWNGSWWTWRTTHWSEVHERTVRSLLYHFTERALYLDAKGVRVPWAPTRRKVGDLLEALAAITASCRRILRNHAG
jgi:putative DNA primase/helicase